MGLKRKRSLHVSPSTSTSSFLCSPSRTSTSPCPDPHQHFDTMDIEAPIPNSKVSSWADSRRELCSKLNSRTYKRARDNRPDEGSIHENTFQKLFSAQRLPHIDILPSYTSYQSQPVNAAPVQTSTLHSFWTLPKPPPPQPIFSAPHPPGFESNNFRCDDCDRELYHLDRSLSADIAMIHESAENACGSCGIRLCDICAVNMSEGRRCLGCARH